MTPLFLSLEDVVEIHRDQIERYGGSPGIRDLNLLRSALAAPEAGVFHQYPHVDIYEMAGAYLFHIVKNHPFIDGNKRVGAMTAFVFLYMNGIKLKAPEKYYENLVRKVAEGKADKTSVTDFFRKYGIKEA